MVIVVVSTEPESLAKYINVPVKYITHLTDGRDDLSTYRESNSCFTAA
jgi:hypothetical protein